MIYHLVLADPLTLALGGLGLSALTGAGSLGAQLFGPKPQAPSMPAPAPPIQSPVGTSASNKNTSGATPSFLAAAATPQQGQLGGKTLLGQ